MKKVLKSKKFLALTLGAIVTGASIIAVAAACAAKVSVVEKSYKFTTENEKNYLTVTLSDKISLKENDNVSVVYQLKDKSTVASHLGDNKKPEVSFDEKENKLKIQVSNMPENGTKVLVVAPGIKYNFIYDLNNNQSNDSSTSKDKGSQNSSFEYDVNATLNENNRPNLEFTFKSEIPSNATQFAISYKEKDSSKKVNDSEKIALNSKNKAVWDSYAWDAGKTYVISNVKFFDEKDKLISENDKLTKEVSIPAKKYTLNLDVIKNAAKNPQTWNSYLASTTFDADFTKSSTTAKAIIDPAIKTAVVANITNEEEKKIYEAVSNVVSNVVVYNHADKTLRFQFTTEAGAVDVKFTVNSEGSNKTLTYVEETSDNHDNTHGDSSTGAGSGSTDAGTPPKPSAGTSEGGSAGSGSGTNAPETTTGSGSTDAGAPKPSTGTSEGGSAGSGSGTNAPETTTGSGSTDAGNPKPSTSESTTTTPPTSSEGAGSAGTNTGSESTGTSGETATGSSNGSAPAPTAQPSSENANGTAQTSPEATTSDSQAGSSSTGENTSSSTPGASA